MCAGSVRRVAGTVLSCTYVQSGKPSEVELSARDLDYILVPCECSDSNLG